MSMNARIFATATIVTTFAGVLTARAADPQLLSMVMPDAKVIAGVNVDSAKSSTLGIYLISQVQTNFPALQNLITLTGFDPTRDLHEILAASNNVSGAQHSGIALARGNFDVGRITALIGLTGAKTETYNGVTILEDPKPEVGVAFLDSSVVVAGDLASVKAAIDRPHTGQSLPSSVLALVNQWSGSQDAWVFTPLSPSSLMSAGTAVLPGLGANPQGLLQTIVNGGAGLKLGANAVATLQATADNAQDATNLANTLQLLVNIGQMQSGSKPDPNLTALLQGLAIAAKGTAVNVTVTLPQAQIQQLMQHASTAAHTVVKNNVVRKK
jgi:hypothetical protein